MTAQEMIRQAHAEADKQAHTFAGVLLLERQYLSDIIRHLCDPEQHPYPMTSPEL